LAFSFPDFGQKVVYNKVVGLDLPLGGLLDSHHNHNIDYEIAYRSTVPLFPEDEINIGKTIAFRYYITKENWNSQSWEQGQTIDELSLKWTLFADDMPPKTGEIPFEKLNNF
jgi:hypothetical protein